MSAKGGPQKTQCNPPPPICQDQTPKCPPPCEPPAPICQNPAPVCQDPCQIQDPCAVVDPCQTQGKGYSGVKK